MDAGGRVTQEQLPRDAINSHGTNLNMLCMAQWVNYRDVIHNQNELKTGCVLTHSSIFVSPTHASTGGTFWLLFLAVEKK